MRTRIQLAGSPFGSKEKTVWRGDLHLTTGIPGMRIVLWNDEGEVEAYVFKQLCIELSKDGSGEAEQVIYVSLQSGNPVILG